MGLLVITRLKNLDFKKKSEALHNKIEEIKLKERGKNSKFGALKGFVYSFRDNNYLYIKVYKEYERKATYFDGDPSSLKKASGFNGEYKSILIASNGYVLYEVSRFFHTGDIKELLKDVFRKTGLEDPQFEDLNEFSLKTMRNFYKSAIRVSSLTVKEVGKVAPNPHMPPREIEKATQDMGKATSSVTMNSSRTQNLKSSQVIDEGLARRSDLTEVKGKDEDGASFAINSNGRIIASVPDKDERKASKFYKIIEKIVGILQ